MDSSAKRGENITLDPDSSRKALDTKPPPNSCSTVSGVSLEKTSSNPAPKQSTTPPISSLSSLVSNPFNDIRQVRIVNDDTLEVVYANPKDKQPDNGRASISVAAFTTCLARHKLYEALEQLQQRVLYFGTDSVIYTTEPGQPDRPCRWYDQQTGWRRLHLRIHLRWTQKLRLQNQPRQSLLQSQIWRSRQTNYDVMRQNILDELTHPLDERRNVDVVNPNFFRRNPATKYLKVITHTKRYGLVFDKRSIDPNTFMSFP